MTRDQLIALMARGMCCARFWEGAWPPADDGVRRALLVEATAALTAIEAAGMRVVPVELTERMWLEARSVGQHEGDWCTNVWEAMIAAAQEDSTSE